jgi:bifunctional DNA-binding transcriptional regulator/antitoxin component of YhaV-PrlF toxin-antitoxin module
MDIHMESLSQQQMRQLTRSLSTKADKIRALARAGVGAGDIARFLGIRYQQAYNVLKRSGIPCGEIGVRDAAARKATTAPLRATLDGAGRLQLPREILEAWRASPGDELLVRLEGDELRVLTRSAGLRLAQDILREYPAGRNRMADELIAERRREARTDG